jgi:hypothetical protein
LLHGAHVAAWTLTRWKTLGTRRDQRNRLCGRTSSVSSTHVAKDYAFALIALNVATPRGVRAENVTPGKYLCVVSHLAGVQYEKDGRTTTDNFKPSEEKFFLTIAAGPRRSSGARVCSSHQRRPRRRRPGGYNFELLPRWLAALLLAPSPKSLPRPLSSIPLGSNPRSSRSTVFRYKSLSREEFLLYVNS